MLQIQTQSRSRAKNFAASPVGDGRSPMASDEVLCDVQEGVMTITLNRPEKLNAFTPAMRDGLIAAIDRADAPDGDGEIDYDCEEIRDSGGRLSSRIFASVKLVIGAVNGAAVGVGATMLLPMDIRLASTAAKFGFPFTRRGIVPEACSTWFLPRAVGMQRAMEWVATGRVFPAEEALTAGLVRSLHAPDDLIPAARAIAAEVVREAAPVSVALSRQLMWRMLGADHPMEAHRQESRLLLDRGRSADVKEGVASFLEKRPPNFTGRIATDMPPTYPGWREPTFR